MDLGYGDIKLSQEGEYESRVFEHKDGWGW